MKAEFDLIGFGDPFFDLVVHLPKLPETNKSCQMKEYCFQGGGNVPTACVAAARLGAKVSLIGCVGDDLFGKLGLNDLQYNGVDISKMKVKKGRKSNFSICITETEIQGKEFISKPGDFSEIKKEELDESFFASAKMLHVALITPAVVKACDIVHKHGGKVSIDANYYRPYVYDHYDKIDLFIGSELYYRCFCEDKKLDPLCFEENMRLLQSYGPEIVVFTFGEEGCRGVFADRYFQQPAFCVNVADTTGAGDVFHGAFDYFYLQKYSIEECAKYASAVSAVKCTKEGGRAGIPSLSVVKKFVKTGKIDYSEIDERVAHYKKGFSPD